MDEKFVIKSRPRGEELSIMLDPIFDSAEDALEAAKALDEKYPDHYRDVHPLGPRIDPPEEPEWVVLHENPSGRKSLVSTVLMTRSEAQQLVDTTVGSVMRKVGEG